MDQATSTQSMDRERGENAGFAELNISLSVVLTDYGTSSGMPFKSMFVLDG